ncbi:MAG: (d)CMP kinase, partial [Candidatus Rokubacteria bacterium]|nr:(d)CMP kinase [Candidatus Rokubacteria bacterium]
DAEVKVDLVAFLETRASRRLEEVAESGVTVDLTALREEVLRRDRQDMGRALAPLVKPSGAVVVDSTGLEPEAVVRRLLEEVERVRCCTGS